MSGFKSLGLREEILQGITELGFENPTPIQEKVIGHIVAGGQDLVGLAQTGTGKTAAFGLPILHTIEIEQKYLQVLILAPTRELCLQITKNLADYSKYMPKVNVMAAYGGENISIQLQALKRNPQIVVATPGRLLDLCKRKKIDLSTINTLVLDEADEMLNMGFKEDLTSIVEQTPETKRTLLFSATMPREVERIAKKYLSNPIEITIGRKNESTQNVSHEYYLIKAENRYMALKRIIDFHPGIYSIVFCRTRQETKDVAEKLVNDGYNTEALHGDLTQMARDAVMHKFRHGNVQILVATDVAARGLDVNNLSHVINYNLPDDKESYTHRSGRTGRAGKEGVSISLVHLREQGKIRDIERKINAKFKKKAIPGGEEICQKQFFNFIERLQNVEVNEEKIAPLMDVVSEKLGDMSREELVSHMVSLEFSRFFKYYENAPDLNIREKRKDDFRDRDRNRDDRNRDDRNRDDRNGGRNNGRRNSNNTRFYINMGEKQNFSPGRFLGMFNEVVGVRSIKVHNIDVMKKFSFFEVDKKYTDLVMDAFTQRYQGKGVKLEISEERSAAPSRDNKDRDRNRGDRDRSRSDRDNRDNRERRPYKKGRH